MVWYFRDFTWYVVGKYVIVWNFEFEMELLICEYQNMIKDVFDYGIIVVELWW